jgi:hypothetical protein
MPYDDFYVSLNCLDNKRLGKQRVEAKQILNVLLNRPRKDGQPYKGWLNHPCVRMWRGYENALKEYFNISVMVWEERGFKNTMEYEDHDGCVPFLIDLIYLEKIMIIIQNMVGKMKLVQMSHMLG